MREDTHADRQVDPAGIVAPAQELTLLAIEARRGSGTVRQPIERDFIEHGITRYCSLRVAGIAGTSIEDVIDPGGLREG
jgi:hypothetical protein